MQTWRGIDTYLQRVDQALCSQACPCYFNNITGFVNNATVSPYFNQWTKTNVPSNTAFQNCSSQVQVGVYQGAQANDAYFDPNNEFNSNNFFNYMSDAETDFQCSGWCNVTYLNTNTNTQMVMFKYLFTDVNNGPPQRLGCLNSVIEWLPPYLMAYGSVTMVLVGFQVIFYYIRL
jgi:hypothetical protein